MDSKLLKTFVTVANHSSFTGAAKELFIAQSAVSKHINQLERELGVQLFLRDTRMVRLTSAGESLYRDGVDILSKMDAAVSALRQNSPLRRGSLSIGVFSCLADEVVKLMRRFRTAYPDISVTLDWYEFGDLIRQLESGNLDLIFSIGFAVCNKPLLHYAPLCPGQLHVVVGRSSPLAGRSRLTLADLEEYSFFTMRPDVTPDGYMTQMRFFVERGFEPRNMVQHTSHETMLLQLQLHDDAYGFMGHFQYRSHPGVVFIPLDEDLGTSQDDYVMAAAWHANNQNPCVPLLVEQAREVFANAIPFP